MKDVKEILDRIVPEPAREVDWDAVLRDARPSRARRAAPRLAILGAAVAFAVLLAVAPWRGAERAGILDRALAAIGDGPVLHVVLRGDQGGTLVNLRTGDREPVYQEKELWYDADRRLLHEIWRFGGAVAFEDVRKPSDLSRETALTMFSNEYRDALESGKARVAGQDVVEGVPVYWITLTVRHLDPGPIRPGMPPEAARQLRNINIAEQVAISRKTFKPVAMRESQLRDGKVLTSNFERVLSVETVDADEADLDAGAPDASRAGLEIRSSTSPIPLGRAAEALGRRPLWLGREYAGQPLGEETFTETCAPLCVTRHVVTESPTVLELFSQKGRYSRTLASETDIPADKLRACLERLPIPNPIGVGQSHCAGRTLEIRDGKVNVLGLDGEWGPERSGLLFVYQKSLANATELPPIPESISIAETTDREYALELASPHGAEYVPPEGWALIVRDRLTPGNDGSSPPVPLVRYNAFLVRDDVYVSIHAFGRENDEHLVLDAAKALRPMPSAGSGAGE